MLKFKVEDMTCGHCIQTVERAVKAIDPAATVSVDLTAKKVEVNGAAPEADIVAAIREAGYQPELLDR